MFEGATQQPGERSPAMISQLLMLPEALIFACSLKYSDVALPPHDLPKNLDSFPHLPLTVRILISIHHILRGSCNTTVLLSFLVSLWVQFLDLYCSWFTSATFLNFQMGQG